MSLRATNLARGERVTAQANLIVSGDRKHLLPLGTHADIAIIDAAEALRRIEAIQA